MPVALSGQQSAFGLRNSDLLTADSLLLNASDPSRKRENLREDYKFRTTVTTVTCHAFLWPAKAATRRGDHAACLGDIGQLEYALSCSFYGSSGDRAERLLVSLLERTSQILAVADDAPTVRTAKKGLHQKTAMGAVRGMGRRVRKGMILCKTRLTPAPGRSADDRAHLSRNTYTWTHGILFIRELVADCRDSLGGQVEGRDHFRVKVLPDALSIGP